MKIFFLRHGETPWNVLKQYQGHTDIPLSENGIAQVSDWQIPKNIEHWYISPLSRAIQTADIHHLQPRTITRQLIEANWGEWEGKKMSELRKLDADKVAKIERAGLDMRPPGGESPREVRDRIEKWLITLSPNLTRIGVVAHRGIIRAALSLATDWDMKSDHPQKVKHNQAFEFTWSDRKLSFIQAHVLNS